jgi:hypothetical protein
MNEFWLKVFESKQLRFWASGSVCGCPVLKRQAIFEE